MSAGSWGYLPILACIISGGLAFIFGMAAGEKMDTDKQAALFFILMAAVVFSLGLMVGFTH